MQKQKTGTKRLITCPILKYHPKYLRLILFLFFLRLADVVYAQDGDSLTHKLPEIVVSDYRSKLQGENVMNVEKIKLSDNAELQGLSLSEKLMFVPGIHNFSTGSGIGKPVIRGLSGNRIAVFSQGIRMENQQWGEEHGLGMDENGYGNVEIIKGPASLLYGSDALGGVIYFIDEPYAENDRMEVNLGSDYHSNTQGWRNLGSIKISKSRLCWNVFGSRTTHEDYCDGGGKTTNNSRFHTGDFKTSFGYAGKQFAGSIKYNFLKEIYGLSEIGENEIGEKQSANGRSPVVPYQNLTTHLLRSENTFFFNNNSKLKADFGYQLNNRKEMESDEDEPAAMDINLTTLSYSIKWYLPVVNKRWTWIVGSQGMYQTNRNRGKETLIPDAATTEAGVFITSDYNYSGKSYWQTGVRVDARKIQTSGFSKSCQAFNFSTGIFQQLTPNGSLRVNFSTGYRTPNLYELLSDGVHEGTNRYEIGSFDLKTENSYQADISLNYKSTHLELFFSPHFNYIRNFIYIQPSSETINYFPVYHYTQTKAYLYGGETGFHFHPHPLDWLHFSGSYSSAWGEDLKNNALPLMPSQKINTTISANFNGEKAIKKFSVYLQNQYSLAQNRIALYETVTPAYNLVNIGFALELTLDKQPLSFNAAITNLFNEIYYDHLSRYKTEGINNMGRNIRISLQIPLRLTI
jgi:iron complex outermembrane receptor protein